MSEELCEKAGDLLRLVGKKKGEHLTAKDATMIGHKMAKMSGAELKSHLGMVDALGGYYGGRKGAKGGGAKDTLTGLRKSILQAYKGAKGKKESITQEQAVKEVLSGAKVKDVIARLAKEDDQPD